LKTRFDSQLSRRNCQTFSAPESGDEAVGLGGFGATVEVAGAQIWVEGAVPEHGIGGSENGSGDRTDGFLGAATGTQAVELGLQVASLRSRRRLEEGRWPQG
jgi:hypothetical protein